MTDNRLEKSDLEIPLTIPVRKNQKINATLTPGAIVNVRIRTVTS
jgi:hypothetical protein